MMHDLSKKKISGNLKLQNKFSLLRISTKLCGLVITFAVLAFLCWQFPNLNNNFVIKIKSFVMDLLPYIAFVSIIYVIFIDMFLPKPKDSYWHVGNIIIRQQKPDWRMVLEHFKAWLIKMFFFSLMAASMYSHMLGMLGMNTDLIFAETDAVRKANMIFGYLHNIAYAIDVAFAVIGYAITFKLLDSNIRSTEPTFLGWFVCLVCYPPFLGFFNSNFFNYNDTLSWGSYFSYNAWIYCLWAGLILLCDFIYAFATVAFGYRFSNLTYRGVITNGPYRFTKHPAYVFKNISWWMISIPFISYKGWDAALGNCLALLFMNFVYYLRARTEENHLSNYPEYVEYAEYMNQHSIFRPLAKILPFLKYSKERAKNSGSRIYKPYAEQQ
jgi:protein-S-isoprenylcysteine O-methyltransferase Ste14